MCFIFLIGFTVCFVASIALIVLFISLVLLIAFVLPLFCLFLGFYWSLLMLYWVDVLLGCFGAVFMFCCFGFGFVGGFGNVVGNDCVNKYRNKI